jgi:riboflavin synthase
MFTGIIECIGKVEDIQASLGNIDFYVSSPITQELKIDQSVAHNGVCLTVVEIIGNVYKVTAIEETLKVTNLNRLSVGDTVNLERCMPANGRFDGHIVQGHVDTTARISHIETENGSWRFTFDFMAPPPSDVLVVHKGSIAVNGISLTVAEAKGNGFSVAVIPYTFHHTSFMHNKVGDIVNIEYDIIGKYIARNIAQYQK